MSNRNNLFLLRLKLFTKSVKYALSTLFMSLSPFQRNNESVSVLHTFNPKMMCRELLLTLLLEIKGFLVCFNFDVFNVMFFDLKGAGTIRPGLLKLKSKSRGLHYRG